MKEMSIDVGLSYGWVSCMLWGLGGILWFCNKKLKVDEFCLFFCMSIVFFLGWVGVVGRYYFFYFLGVYDEELSDVW